MKLVKLLFFFLISLKSIGANYYVNDNSTVGDIFCTSIGSNSTGDGTSSKPFATFNKLWNSRNGTFMNGDVIYVDAGTYTSYTGGDGFGKNCGYTIQASITIEGAGASKTIFDNQSLYGSNSSYVANGGGAVTNGTFSYFAVFTGSCAGAQVKNIRFQNYRYGTTSYGQCFSINGMSTSNTPITFTNVEITKCQNSITGFAAPIFIYSAGNVTNKFVMNGGGIYCNGNATSNGGGIDVQGGIALSSKPNVKIQLTDVAIIGNTKYSNPQCVGGSITQKGDFSTDSLIIRECLFDGNYISYSSTTSAGSAIYSDVTSGTPIIRIDKSTFQNNSITGSSSTSNGATLYFAEGNVVIDSTLIQNNVTTVGTGSVKGNIASNAAVLTISNCKFVGNSANNAKDVYLVSSTGSVTITNTFLNSSATQIMNNSTGSFTTNYSGNPTTSGTITKSNTSATIPTFVDPSVPTFTGGCSTSNVVLPIELLYFNPYYEDGKVKIKWATATEHNNDYFTIEKSTNGTDYTTIDTIKSIQNSTSLTEYYSEDPRVTDILTYYRLKQVDIDGGFTLTEWRSVLMNIEISEISLYPLPAKDNVYLTLKSEVDDTKNIYITDMMGKIIYQNDLIIKTGYNNFTINFDEISDGWYLLNFDRTIFKIEIKND